MAILATDDIINTIADHTVIDLVKNSTHKKSSNKTFSPKPLTNNKQQILNNIPQTMFYAPEPKHPSTFKQAPTNIKPYNTDFFHTSLNKKYPYPYSSVYNY